MKSLDSLDGYLTAIACLPDLGEKLSITLANHGMKLGLEYWGYSIEANEFKKELLKEWVTLVRSPIGAIGYRSVLVSRVLQEAGLDRSVFGSFDRTSEVETRVRSHPALAHFTIESASRAAATVAVDAIHAVRNNELTDIGETEVFDAIGLMNTHNLGDLTFERTVTIFDEIFTRCGFVKLLRKPKLKELSRSCVAAYRDASGARGGIFFLSIDSFPDFSAYFSIRLSVCVDHDMSMTVAGKEISVRRDDLLRSVDTSTPGFGYYASAQLKTALPTSLYAYTFLIPEVIRIFRDALDRPRVELQWLGAES
jgi:hypothetical protein